MFWIQFESWDLLTDTGLVGRLPVMLRLLISEPALTPQCLELDLHSDWSL